MNPPTRTTTPRPELLAPAGDWEAMRAAVANGADAVYFGLSDFNARHRATNFTVDELPRVIEYLHGHNVRGYVTLNTLIFSDELGAIAELVAKVARAGADAVIVQDLGLVELIRATAPQLAIHGSTQMTLTEPRGIEFVRSLGVERVIVARELSIADIRKIRAATIMPVEAFVHGALCVAYSGQCLTSESLGGRSANRGQCAQACRLPYELVVDGGVKPLGDVAYLLSPQDLAAYDLIGEMADAGVCSFKIEGRLKSPHYVAATTQTYRAAIDAAVRQRPFTITPAREIDLAQSFTRGFAHGFLGGVDHQRLVHGKFSKKRGVRVGTVAARTDEGLVIGVERGFGQGDAAIPIKAGDGVVFAAPGDHPEQDEQGGRVFEVRPQRGRERDRVEIVFGRGDVNLNAVALGAAVWKTDDPAVRKRLEHSYSRAEIVHRVPVTTIVEARVGEPLRLRLSDDAGHHVIVESDQRLEMATRHPATLAMVREQLGRLGDTPFELQGVELRGEGGAADSLPVMIPKSLLNDLRRRAAGGLLGQRESAAHGRSVHQDALAMLRSRIAAHESPVSPDVPPSLYLLTRTLDQLRAVLDWIPAPPLSRAAMVYCDFEDVRRYKEAVALARAAAMPIALATLRIVKPGEEGLLQQIADQQPDAVVVRNLAAVGFFSGKLPMIGDYSLNIANELTASLFARAGVTRMVPSYDLNWEQLGAMVDRFPAAGGLFETVVHQHMPMFHMEHCVFCHTLSSGHDYRDCGRPCDTHKVELRDRVAADHPLVADAGCRNTVFNGAAQSAAEYVPRMLAMGLRHFRVELLRESGREAVALVEKYARVIAGLDDPRSAVRALRVLTQLGVTRGTLEF